jgi:hypothetical protein
MLTLSFLFQCHMLSGYFYLLILPLVVLPDREHPPHIPPRSPTQPWLAGMIFRSRVRLLEAVGAPNPVPCLRSTPVPGTVAIRDADSCSIAIVIGVVLSPIVMSTASTPHCSASAISTSLPALGHPSGAVTLRLSSVLCTPDIGPGVCMFSPGGSLLLLSCASLVASFFFAHLLLNVM